MYLAFKVLARIEEGWFESVHNCLANIALFIQVVFLRPKPLLDLGLQRVSQLMRWGFLLSLPCPHQKLLIVPPKELWTDSRTLKQE